jgi:hypothetical protein
MLGMSPGVVIHADGESVKMELFADALGSDLSPDRFRVVRRDDPPLTDVEQVSLAYEAQRFFKQQYYFIYGRTSGPLGRALRDRRGITFPFCSELVATAYLAIGRPVASLSPDRTLPVDLEQHCIPPVWRDVSSAFHMDIPSGMIPGMDSIQVGERMVPFRDFFTESDRLMQQGAALTIQTAATKHSGALLLVEACVSLQAAKSMALNIAKLMALKSELLFGIARSTVESDLHALAGFYQQIKEGLSPEEPSIASLLKQVFPEERDRGAFEVLPSFKRLTEFELLGESLAFGARALRLRTAMAVIAAACNVPIKGFQDLSESVKNAAAPFILQVEALSESKASELLADVSRFSVASVSYTEQLREQCANVVKLHRVLSILRSAVAPVPLSTGSNQAKSP